MADKSSRAKQFILNLVDKLERLESYVENDLPTAKIRSIELRLNDLNTCWLQFQKCLPPYEKFDAKEFPDGVLNGIEEAYFDLRPQLEDKIQELRDESNKGGENAATASPNVNVQLPKISLDTFSGDYMEWKGFFETFNALVHSNTSLSDLAKFQYLKRSLKGIAAQTIDALDFSTDNYLIARELLTERFEKHHLICDRHINSLFVFKSIDRPCPKRLLELIDHFKSHLRSLESLGRPVNRWDDLIVYIMVSKLDTDSKSRWIDDAPSTHIPTFDDICNFIRKRAHKLEIQPKISSPMPTNTPKPTPKFVPRPPRSSTALTVTKTTYFCIHCNTAGHTIVRCHKFLSLSIDERQKFVQESKLCNNCLRPNHKSDACPVVDRCRHCNKAHHSLLHHSVSTPPSTHISNVDPCTSSSSTALSSSSSAKPRPSSFVYLATALVNVLDKFGRPVVGRALLDSGSQINFMTESFRAKLKIPGCLVNSSIHGIGTNVVSSHCSATITVMSRTSNFSSTLDTQILPKITGYQPPLKLNNVDYWAIPANIQLADPAFFESQSIDLLIGAEIYHSILSIGQITLSPKLPILQNTLLGWVVSGKAILHNQTDPVCHLTTESLTESLHDEIEKFWSIENIPHSTKPRSTEEKECEDHFIRHTKRDKDGRFIVKLPFSSDPSTLGNSKEMATRRFLNLEKRLHRSTALMEAYASFMDEYKTLGHMDCVDSDSVVEPNFYFPHHCVVKPDSSTTKLRVVFDGSATSSSGKSLNSILQVGPTVQNELFAILIRFRTHMYAFSADITKMYRQVRIHEDDQQFQYILWRKNSEDVLQTYKLNTVTYGTSSAPYLATRCLNQLSIDHRTEYPSASETIEKDIYVDDLLTGARSVGDAQTLKAEVQQILQSAGMELRKWCSNNPGIIADIPLEHRETFVTIDDNDLIKTLGILWQPSSDVFTFALNMNNTSIASKRSIFSQIARIFDPLGLLAPVVVLGKLLIQSIWQLRLDWDQSLPQNLHTQWQHLRDNLVVLNDFSIDRCLLSAPDPLSIQIHGFADASERAFGAVLYVRSHTSNGKITVKLLCSKSRVAPLKSVTLPRLELCAANLLADLTQKIRPILNINVDQFFFWSDSTITLHWIKSSPSRWKTFVRNRVASIQEVTNPDSWYHVSSDQNPADLISRGVSPDKFVKSSIWVNGPKFLLEPQTVWSKSTHDILNLQNSELEASSSSSTHHVIRDPEDDIITTIRSNHNFMKLQRVVAYLLRLKREPKYRGQLQQAEFTRSHETIIRSIQRMRFPEEVIGLQKSNFVVKNPLLKSLNLFLDEKNIIRVGGRLQNSTLPYESKHPILLPSNHNFTLIVLLFYHKKYHHVGPQALLAAVRELYWPLHGKRLCSKIHRECIRCFRVRPTMMAQQMGNLPAERVTPSPPFYSVGVDYCGPFFVHHRIRGKQPTKTYLCVFICFVTKAIHLELSSDLSTSSFLGAFKRFIATRGVPKRVFSDNGTNFVGANSTLRELYNLLSSDDLQDELQTFCQRELIEWKFIPPYSPNFGGLHEAGVKLAKFHLRRVIGTAKFTFEQLLTVMKEVEAILNSRPLMPLSSSPSDYECLTPGHLLIGRPLTSLPPEVVSDRPPLDTWRLIDHVKQSFWNRWSTEYLRSQQQRRQWTKSEKNLAVNDLVVLIDDNLPPLKWKLGRIIETFPGNDDLVRVVKVKTAQGEHKRGVSKICRLPDSIETGLTFQGGEYDEL